MNFAADAVPQSVSLVIRLASILEPLDLAGAFARSQPLEVELGSGDGSFLIEYARRCPDRNFIGVERLLGRLRKTDRKGLRAGLPNLRLVRIEAGYFIDYLLPPASVSALHVYFPDPWPKRRHRHHRLINERFPGLAGRILQPGGLVYLRTDDADYFAQMRSVFAAAAPLFAETETPASLQEVLTDFERDFHVRGTATLRSAYRRAT